VPGGFFLLAVASLTTGVKPPAGRCGVPPPSLDTSRSVIRGAGE